MKCRLWPESYDRHDPDSDMMQGRRAMVAPRLQGRHASALRIPVSMRRVFHRDHPVRLRVGDQQAGGLDVGARDLGPL
jgi:hypothetical protein